MLHKTLKFGYVSTVGNNPNQIDFENWVLRVSVNTYQIEWHTKKESNIPDGNAKDILS